VGEFQLEACEFRDLTTWRWVLTDTGGTLVADHEVQLDAGCWQYEAFTDLLRYLDRNVAPDRRIDDEARIVEAVGDWIAGEVFGPVAAQLVRAALAEPATVRVLVPAEPDAALSLLFRPLELARLNGKTLPVHDVTLVMCPGGHDRAVEASPVVGRLRVLGLFSMPEGGRPLNLRQERQALMRLVDDIAAVDRAAEVRVLQYGVTRDRLRDVLQAGDGWDVVHISGHGLPGELLLEKPDGSPDRVSAADLAGLLEFTRERVKLVTVSACWSGALAAADQRNLLGLSSGRNGGSRGEAGASDSPVVLAAELARRLRCAVLAMRFPVNDEFAIALTGKLYDLLARQGQPLPRALAIALRDSADSQPTASGSVLSAGTPALFGANAVGLRLAAPARAGADCYDTSTPKMAGFPPLRERFVGRTSVMARASAALAAASGVPGVLLHGMPGGGKTACALELAFTHEHAFDQLVWFKVPDEGRDIRGTLTDFAFTLERNLPGFHMVNVVADEAKLTAFLPKMTELMEYKRLLVVIDNTESLLGRGGQWQDARWGQVLNALCAHAGRGRILLTSRRRPAVLPGHMLVQPVDALSLDESLLLARELPHLRDLIQGTQPGVEQGIARRLARGVLNVAQGHPTLLELANGQAADHHKLAALVQAGGNAWQKTGGLPDGFFATGDPPASEDDYLRLLAAWTRAISETATPGERTLFWFLCCLEDDHRTWPVVSSTWTRLRKRLHLHGEPPDPGLPTRRLAACGLITIKPGTAHTSVSYSVHPAIAAAGREQAGTRIQEAVDLELARYWQAALAYAVGAESANRTTSLAVTAGLAAVPYLMRRGDLSAAAQALEQATTRDHTRRTAALALPRMQAIFATGHDPRALASLARILHRIDPATGIPEMRAVLDHAITREDYKTASAAAGSLSNFYSDTGRLAEALSVLDERADYTRLAGLGPWSLLSDQVTRLQLIAAMGRPGEALEQLQRLRDQMQALPERNPTDNISEWQVREMLFSTGREAAYQLFQWKRALEFNAENVASIQGRGAPANEIAHARYNDYQALIQLGRLDEALALLQECKVIFENSRDLRGVGMALSALAGLEDERGHGDIAIRLEQDALRYKYTAGDVTNIATGYFNLGHYLKRHARQPAMAFPCHLAAALIYAVTGTSKSHWPVRSAAQDARDISDGPPPVTGIAELASQLAWIDGADLEQLITELAPDKDVAERTLRELYSEAFDLAAAPPVALSMDLAEWDPWIAALIDAKNGDTRAAAALQDELARYQDVAPYSVLVASLRRVQAGETSPETLAGLDERDAAIVSRAIDALQGRVMLPRGLGRAIGIGPLLRNLVAGAIGDKGAAERARAELDALAAHPDLLPLTVILGRILDGEIRPELATELSHPVYQAVVTTVLHHITT